MFIRKFLCEPLSFVSWRDLNQLYSLPHKVLDSLSRFGALNALFASVRRRDNLCPTHIPLFFTVVMFFCTYLVLDKRIESHQGSLSGNVALVHIYGHGESAVIFPLELQLEGKVSSYVEDKHISSQQCCSHGLLLKNMARVNECRKMEEKQSEGEVSLIYEPPLLLQRKYIPSCKIKKGMENKSSS